MFAVMAAAAQQDSRAWCVARVQIYDAVLLLPNGYLCRGSTDGCFGIIAVLAAAAQQDSRAWCVCMFFNAQMVSQVPLQPLSCSVSETGTRLVCICDVCKWVMLVFGFTSCMSYSCYTMVNCSRMAQMPSGHKQTIAQQL
jgi:hypothetical protein